ncbi:Nup84p NDAI_0B03340 [Naumovozyma dairenensis CBS 421]|uniref:Nuclear pore complex protein n=1 Tax=Naumovozyma dairenensis (strain ATCC 10597 / BCRC 20456 / CBS 421 / NBRC 0211 / NRRL Y-12639) TaxID=1071378 RepID=G0W6F7_NAUDC|nr:hypothetical protein NDAI_0B03340 [Naumovozyma dairenensis CBS 421]CCD23368.1 hypothetical protein NDAI_0B03340 [Naumovozyma dairenensis CBS 421]
MDMDFPLRNDISTPLSGQIDQKKQHFVKFSDALMDFQEAEQTEEDIETSASPFDMIKQFRSIAGELALSSIDKAKEAGGETTNNDYNDWELEARFWHLLDLLISYRVSDHDMNDENENENHANVVYPYNSSAIFEKDLLSKDHQLYQIWIIIVWLQENRTVGERPTSLPTSKWVNTLISGGGLKSSDLDARLRDPAVVKLHEKDIQDDQMFFKYIYDLLLSGNYDELFDECRLSENLTFSMILCGMQEYVNPKIDTQVDNEFDSQQGVKKHALWRRAVFALSKSSNIGYYERAIYQYLAGVILEDNNAGKDQAILMDWETEFLLYLNQIFQIEVENYLLQNNKFDSEELVLQLPSKSISLPDILNLLASKYPTESESPIRVLIGAIILDKLPSLVHSSVEMLQDLVAGEENNNDLLDEPYLLRVMTHLVIFLDFVTPGIISKLDKKRLITAYISILKLHGLYESIPIYINFLEPEDALEAYSFILSTMEDPIVREKQLKLMIFLKLPKSDILKRTTQRVFTETESEYEPKNEISVIFEVNDIDKHLIYNVEWLLEGKYYMDAMEAVIALARRFLINGKVKALDFFFKRNSVDDLVKNYDLTKLAAQRMSTDDDSIILDCKTQELRQYERLIDGLNNYEQWNKTVKLLNSESNIPSLIEKFREYTDGTYDIIKTFLVDLTENHDHPEQEILHEIRSLYTPFLIIELHKGLVEASKLLKIPKFINEALNYTSLVANETDKIYLLFKSSNKLKEYLQLVANTATLVE